MDIKNSYAWTLILVSAAAVVALFINAQLGFFVLLFGLIGWWAALMPWPALGVLIVLAPLLPLFKFTQTIGTVTLVKDVIILTLLVRLVLWPLLHKTLPFRRVILAGPLLLLGGWTAVSALRADALLLGLLRARDIVLYALLFVATLYLPRRQEWYRSLLCWFLVSAVIVGCLGWYQFYVVPDSTVLRFDPARSIWIPRVSSTLAHPSVFGHYLIIVSMLLVALIGERVRHRWLYAILFLFFMPLVYYTYSRAVWLGYAAGLGAIGLTYVWMWLQGTNNTRRLWRVAPFAVLAVLVVMLGLVQFTTVGVFVRSIFDPTYGSNAARLEFVARLVSPLTPLEALFGAGLGDVVAQSFKEVELETFDITSGASRTVQLAKDITLVDNQYLKTFVEMGLAGLLIYAWMYWRFSKASLALLTNHDSLITHVLGRWGLGFLAAFLVQAFFIDIWDIFPTNAAFWIITALVAREQMVSHEA